MELLEQENEFVVPIPEQEISISKPQCLTWEQTRKGFVFGWKNAVQVGEDQAQIKWDDMYQYIVSYMEEYAIAHKEIARSVAKPVDAELEIIFKGLAKNWREATGGFSLNMRRYTHETYQVLIHTLKREDAKDVVPLILRELQQRPDMWFEALKTITQENPGKDSKTFDDAVRAWLNWGKVKRYID
jgi:hypothetical protein